VAARYCEVGHRSGPVTVHSAAWVVLRSYCIPFAQSNPERMANGYPRLSLEERYKTHDRFVRALRKAARQLVRERFLLQVDPTGPSVTRPGQWDRPVAQSW